MASRSVQAEHRSQSAYSPSLIYANRRCICPVAESLRNTFTDARDWRSSEGSMHTNYQSSQVKCRLRRPILVRGHAEQTVGCYPGVLLIINVPQPVISVLALIWSASAILKAAERPRKAHCSLCPLSKTRTLPAGFCITMCPAKLLLGIINLADKVCSTPRSSAAKSR